jgi:DNA invertase Pin-like site-specific DNA recombinase
MKSMKLIGYIRVSTARQGEGFSLKAQKEAITRYCKTYKHKLIAIEAESNPRSGSVRCLINSSTSSSPPILTSMA